MAAEEEDDYMSMVIEEPQQKETFTQKKRRLQREAEARAKVPSKAERAAQEAAKRDAALATSTLNPSSKGFKMMAKLGFKPGQTLGKPMTCDGASSPGDKDKGDPLVRSRTEPLNLIFKEDRGGIGLDSERKRKFREEAEDAVKKVKQEQGDYRDRVRLERETKRTEAQVHAAQKVAERLDAEENGDAGLDTANTVEEKDKDGDKSEANESGGAKAKREARAKVKPTSQISVLYRGLVREREEKERAIQTRHMLQTSLPSSFFPNPRLPGYDDAALDREDREALSDEPHLSTVLEQEVEEEDPELDEFNALEPAERLRRLVQYLREKHYYCFWCKYRYDTAELEGCPGVTEEDHD
ncbi:putative G-patch domain protein [Aspergillus lucknowensis]|uniref:G-patch domain-containing protein n=1 Tax=Aspergillus lucknowensis TaxID=176173 RepID=A0ABR4LZQ7_9EURO